MAVKRKKAYKPRRGIHFDRSILQGPAAAFLGSDLQVVTITGSVQRSVTELDGEYKYPTVPFAGYPKSPGDMHVACLGNGDWVDGFLCEEYDSGLTSSFNTSHVLHQTGSNISFRNIGFRGPADDYAIGLTATGTLAYFTASDLTHYGIGSGSDLAILFVGKQSSGGGTERSLFYKYAGGSTGGYICNVSQAVYEDEPGIFTMRHTVDFYDETGAKGSVFGDVPFNQWYVGLLTFERAANSASFTTINMETGKYHPGSSNDISTWTGTMGSVAAGGEFSLGGYPTFSRNPPDITLSAFYIASGTNAAAGFIGNEENILRSFSRIIFAKNGYLFSGSAVIDKRFGNSYESLFARQLLLGLGTASLGRARGVSVVTTGTIPSWTNRHLGGGNRAYVSNVLTSSHHETVYNSFFSGTEPVETTAVPASASMYYSKHSRYRHVVVKKSASIQDLTRLPTTMDGMTPVYFVAGKGTDITTVTGTLSYFPQTQYALQDSTVLVPALIPIEVPFSGRIVDIKVWIELMQTSGSGETDSAGNYPLGCLSIALRSPNVRGFHAHPIRNDIALKKVFTSNIGDFSSWGAFGTIGRSLFGPDYIAPFYRDTFILWEGPGIFGEGSSGPWDVDDENGLPQFVTMKYPSWQRDRGMRTVFSDGASIPNPRHHKGPPGLNYNGAPNAYHGFNNALGFDVPWTSEAEISGAGGGNGTYHLAGSPPRGWLSGPGGTADVNEWPTTGVNYGADYLRPLYPLLDPLYQRKRYNDPVVPTKTSTGSALFDPDKWTGYRPGLRGTEVSGTWYLLLADSRQSRDTVTTYTPTYFRQVRLEFVLESGSYESWPRRADSRLNARRAQSEVLMVSISGSDAVYDGTGSWDAHISDTYHYLNDDDYRPEVSRTIGIGLLTGSAESGDYAVMYRLTGALADLSGTTPGWLLNNEFGVPRIPISSASLIDNPYVHPETVNPHDLLGERTILDGARRLADAAKDANPPLTLIKRFAVSVSGTAT